MKDKKFFNRFRIVTAGLLFIPSFLLSFYLLSRFVHYSVVYLLVLSILAIVGHLFNKNLNETIRKELNKFNDMFEGIEFPGSLLKVREVGFELIFPLLLLAIGADPIKDIIELKPVIYKINYLFFDVALFILFFSLVPMFSWMFYSLLKESIKKYW